MRDDEMGEVPADSVEARAQHWRRVCLWTSLGLLGWLLVTWAVVWFARDFNAWTVAGAPAGYWLAAQGAIGAYLIIIIVHGRIMDGLEQRRQVAIEAAQQQPPRETAS
jgi:putative solute:sodium symporter small subunit